MKKVLLVEDNSTITAIIRVYLMPLGLELHEARDGEEGLALARRLVPDLILSDAQMPKLDGFQLCAAVRADAVLSATPFVLFTTLADETSLRKGRMVGATAFLPKNIVPAELNQKVQELLAPPGGSR
jgi:twitching motility two-component system response regulator PilG